MFASIFPLGDEDPFLHPKDVAGRITTHFPNALVDWEAANARLQAELEQLQKAGAPPEIVAGHRNLFGNTVHIEVYSQHNQAHGVSFFVYLDSPIEVESISLVPTEEERTHLSSLVSEIARCLKYDVDFSA